MECCLKCDSYCSINRKLLPMKFHLFLYAAGIATVLPFCPILAKSLGITATEVGIIYTIVPFITVLVAPVFGWITDRLKEIKIIIIILVVIHIPAYFAINFIPEIKEERFSFAAGLSCSSNASYLLKSPKFSSLKLDNRSLECYAQCNDCLLVELCDHPQFSKDISLCAKTLKLTTQPISSNTTHSLYVKNMSTGSYNVLLRCSEISSDRCKTKCYIESGMIGHKTKMFETYQFWLMLVLVATSLVTTNVIISLSDAACYEQIEQDDGNLQQFGKQKMWYSVGWGAVTLMTGYIIDVSNTNKEDKTNYSLGFYMMVPIMFCDIIALTQISVKKVTKSKHILKDIGKIFTKPHPFFIVIAVYLVGAFSGIQWNYKFWYLEDMGAEKLLLGLSSAVSCFCGHVPCLFVSGWIINKIGRDNSMCLAFLAFFAWFVPASYLLNPWWILLFDLTQGPCFGLFYAAMSSYAKITAPLGTEATMQSILGATFYGLGIGSGSLLGGLGFDNYGGRMTFRFSGFFALALTVVYKTITRWVAGEQTGFHEDNNEMARGTRLDMIVKNEKTVER